MLHPVQKFYYEIATCQSVSADIFSLENLNNFVACF